MTGIHELLLHIDRASGVPLVRQLYEGIRDGVLKGRLRSGDALPATRQLAQQLRVSRTVVLNAYDQLLADGYLRTRHGSGTFISPGAAAVQAQPALAPDGPAAGPAVRALFAGALPPEPAFSPDPPGLPPVHCDFRHGVPAWDAFPMDRWQKAVSAALARAGSALLGYGPAEGVAGLREAVARIMRLTRAVPADPARIVITTGATQALDLLARLTVEPGDVVVIEDPAHPVLRQIFAFCGATVVPVPVDGEGLRVDRIDAALAALPAAAAPRRVRLVYVTPAHQFPTGAVMSLSRKLGLLDWARRHGALIVEDDYDSEFWYGSPKISAMAGLDSSDNVVYVGSFSKTMFPALRLGYALLPPRLLQPFRTLKWTTDRLTPTVEQQALADFIDSGSYGRHLAAMTRLYGRRRTALVTALQERLGARLTVSGAAAGLHLLASVRAERGEDDIAARCRTRGVRVYPASALYYVGRPPEGASFLLGYAALPEPDIAAGVRVLAAAVGAGGSPRVDEPAPPEPAAQPERDGAVEDGLRGPPR